MKRLLPILFLFICFLAVFLVVIPKKVSAQTINSGNTPATGNWVEDQEVTFVGKTASRSADFLNWTLQNYSWACVTRISSTQCDNTNNPITSFWAFVRNIVYVFLILFVIISAFIIVITRGQNITVMKFIPRFLFIVVLVTFSFSLLQFIYVGTDIIQGCFLRLDCRNVGGTIIGPSNLLFVGFDYNSFIGYRRIGAPYEESAFISLLLVRLTAFTYYAMTFILLVRKIILWFFIIISAVFPLLLFYNPLRNTAKIWIGEFFRWLLYAPLFAIFLHGLVSMWESSTPTKSGIPLAFDFSQVGTQIYPTAINILLGGPGQPVGINNSVNLRDTFGLYVVALLMLWIVILLPFLLLNIFLEYLKSISIANSQIFKRIASRPWSFTPRPPENGSQPPTPVSPQGAGLARALPFFSSTAKSTKTISLTNENLNDARAATEIMRLTNLSIPKMRDIARYESSLISRDSSRHVEISHTTTALEKIANPALSTNTAERERFTTMREKLVSQKQKGDPVATSILNASSISSASVSRQSLVDRRQVLTTQIAQTTNTVEKEKLATQLSTIDRAIEQKTNQESRIGMQASQFAKEANKTQVMSQVNLPFVNKVQQVSLEDYEEVRKMWEENYKTLEPPKSMNGVDMTRREWIKSDITKINQVINMLASADPQRNREGMDMVANILPFLLIGGFSRSEVIAYLKAKLEAAKSSESNIEKKDEEEDTLLTREKEKKQEDKQMAAEAEIDDRGDSKFEDKDEKVHDEDKSNEVFEKEDK